MIHLPIVELLTVGQTSNRGTNAHTLNLIEITNIPPTVTINPSILSLIKFALDGAPKISPVHLCSEHWWLQAEIFLLKYSYTDQIVNKI